MASEHDAARRLLDAVRFTMNGMQLPPMPGTDERLTVADVIRLHLEAIERVIALHASYAEEERRMFPPITIDPESGITIVAGLHATPATDVPDGVAALADVVCTELTHDAFSRMDDAELATMLATELLVRGFVIVPEPPSDPMDRPPADHGSDRYDYVEVILPPGVPKDVAPSGPWWGALLLQPCADCRANIFATYLTNPCLPSNRRNAWDIKIAHDDGCPHVPRS